MKTKRLMFFSLLAAALGGSALPVQAELPVEQVTVAKMPPAHPYRLYFADVSLFHIPDGKMTVIDGRNLKVESIISTGMFAQSSVSNDRSEIYVVTTFFSKLNHGDRSEWILVYDTNTMKLKAEIPYPAHHTQALPYIGTMRPSGDGKFIYVQNATPATSISIVNRETGQHVTEVPTPGCYIVYPAQTTRRVSTLCGDGTMLTITHDEEGKLVGKKKTAKFFDPDGDALFVSAAQDGDNYHFVSFMGNVVSANVAGESAVVQPTWALGTAADVKGGWRPGGYQPVALHKASGTLYVGVHPKGKEGSHKDPAKEIWAYDLATKARVARVKTDDATGLATSQGVDPRLFAFDTAKASVTAFTGLRRLKKAGSALGFGDTPTQMEVQ